MQPRIASGWLACLCLSACHGAEPSPQPQTQIQARPPSDVVLDLSSSGADPTAVPVTEVSRPVRVAIASLAPAARYTLSYDNAGRPVTEEVRHSATYVRNSVFLDGPCGPMFARIFDLAESAEAEDAIPGRVAALRATSTTGCSSSQQAAQAITSLTMAEISVPIRAGESREVTVRRLAADGQAARQWVFLLQGPGGRRWEHGSEQDWIVASVVREIDRGLGGTGGNVLTKGASGAPPVVGVRLEGARPYEGSVTLAPYVWAPSAYVGVAAALLGGGRALSAQGAVPSADHLADLRASVIFDESVAALRALKARPSDPAAHERAALVLAALAFRESAGSFSDPRLLLSRTAGRLAVAKAMRGANPWGLDGEVADALLLVLSGRTADAKAASVRLQGYGRPGGAAWGRAIALRATGDWRGLAQPEKATLVERLEYLRALVGHKSASSALGFLGSFKPEPVADWGRILMNVDYSVETVNRFGRGLFDAELAEAESIRSRLLGQGVGGANLVADLNTPPGTPLKPGTADPGIVDWGTWASFYQRHAAFGAATTSRALGHMLAAPDEAARFWGTTGPAVAGWWTFPFLKQRVSMDSRDLAAGDPARARAELGNEQAPCPAIVAAISKEPEKVPAGLWAQAQNACAKDALEGRLPSADAWFGKGLLEGTVFDLHVRLPLQGLAKLYGAGNGAGFASLHDLDPYDWILVNYWSSSDPALKVSAAQRLKAYGSLTQYDLPGLLSLAKSVRKGAPAEALDMLSRACSIEADSCFEYADALADLDRSEEAAAVYRKAFDTARDRVAAAAHTGWLIDYYMNRGKPNDALALAQSGAETYSGTGLLTLGDTFERLGRYDEARQQFEAVRERYRDDSALQRFYIRAYLGRKDERFAENAKSALASYFPKGLSRATLADLRQAGATGTTVVDETKTARDLGLLVGDSIVGLNGYRVDTMWQYVIVRSITDRANLKLVIRRGSEYKELAAVQKSFAGGLLLRP